VAAAFALAMAVVLAATGLFLYLRLASHLSLSLDRGLRLRAHDVAVVVQDPKASLATATGAPFVESGEIFAQLIDDQGRVVDASRSLGGAQLLTEDELGAARARPVFANRGSVPGLDEPARLLATPVERDGRRFVLVVGSTREDRAETLRSFRNVLLVAGPVALALATLAGYALAGLSLRPVESMRRRAATISAETPGERLPVPETRDEIERLGQTLNAMLARIDATLARERDFVADAGHELRTPLALLRTELELALRHAESPDELKEAIRSSSEEVERLAQLAEDLLLIARSDRGELPLQLEAVDADELLTTVASRFEWRAHEAGRPVLTEARGGLSVRGDRIRLEQALSNLVDNAMRHGAGEVRLRAAAVDELVELHVTDEGAGFPPEFLEQAFERFTRSDQARPRGGSGLGLSIVRVIAEAHGGHAQVANVNGGGTDAWIAVPRGAAATPGRKGSA
jgi:heavy metal sensor kinase